MEVLHLGEQQLLDLSYPIIHFLLFLLIPSSSHVLNSKRPSLVHHPLLDEVLFGHPHRGQLPIIIEFFQERLE